MKSLSLDTYKLFPGVIFLEPSAFFIEDIQKVEIGEGTIIEPFVKLIGKIKIGKNCRLYFGFTAHNFECGDNCELGMPAQVTDVKTGNNCRIGRFAEIKRSVLGDDVNCIHHCYIGDTEVSNGVNIGAGAITANFDGENKKKTVIKDGAFIGVNSNLVAPIEVGQEAFVAAGSTVGDNVKPHALAITRAARRDVPNFWQKVGKNWKRIKPR